jgi:hypothetical protein
MPYFMFTAILVQITAGQMAAAARIDNRLQLWFIDDAGKLWTASKQTTDPDANWTSWASWRLPGNASAS